MDGRVGGWADARGSFFGELGAARPTENCKCLLGAIFHHGCVFLAFFIQFSLSLSKEEERERDG